ncbi:methylosome protein WDR77 isoform X1 [Leptinotarsa decemlineata]|uniref:methylosome protein WDR77 isoform X1 n=1 Tax=Leptinotarsa decemlineata TaxID=7539 RepID=UPI003D307EDA
MPYLQETQFLAPDGAIFPPNKPMEPRTHFSESPIVYDNFLFLDFNDDGNCILGTSEISGTFWEGTLLYFQDYHHMETLDFHGHFVNSSTSDGKFLSKNVVSQDAYGFFLASESSNCVSRVSPKENTVRKDRMKKGKIALSEDTGHINVLSLDEDNTIRTTNYFKLIERVPRIEVWNNSHRILCCSGRSVSIWDADSDHRKPLQTFEDFHTDRITCLDTMKQNPNLFLTGARDRMACIWDLRNSIPSSVLYINEFSTVTSISWNQMDNNYIIVGTQAGDVYLLDKREPKDFVSTHHCFNAPINQTGFNGSKKFAVCGDISDVLIVNCVGGNLETVYQNDSHNGHVKGLKWHKGNLYTCGFGKCIVKHVMKEKCL